MKTATMNPDNNEDDNEMSNESYKIQAEETSSLHQAPDYIRSRNIALQKIEQARMFRPAQWRPFSSP